MQEQSPNLANIMNFQPIASELLGKGLKRQPRFLRALWDGFLCSAQAGAMGKFPGIGANVISQRRKGDVCSDAHPAAF